MAAKIRNVLAASAAALALLLTLAPSPALAVLKDRGPVNALRYPTWYRDNNLVALDLCVTSPLLAAPKTVALSENADAAGFEMCLVNPPNPAGFAGNFGDEGFYYASGSLIPDPLGPPIPAGFSARLDLAVEAAYAVGPPIVGDEITFSRERILIEAPVAGVYTVTHPFGTRTFVIEATGPRALFFTSDIGITTFDTALGGVIGPFLEWAPDSNIPGAPYGVNATPDAFGVNQPYKLTTTDVNGNVTQYLGDPNIGHTVINSPFNTNFFRVDGPAGSGIGGLDALNQPIDFVSTDQFSVMGRKYLAPIANPLAIDHAVYAVDPVTGAITIAAGANAAPTANLVASAGGMPTLPMIPDGTGRFGIATNLPAPGPVPANLTVTNLSDVPPTSKAAEIIDVVTVTSASYDAALGILSVAANSSDTRAVVAGDPNSGPVLAIVDPAIGPMTAGATPGSSTYLTVAPPEATIAPWRVTVQSSRGGKATEPVVVFGAAVAAANAIAVQDAAVVDQSPPPPGVKNTVVIPVLANDTDAAGLPLVGARPVVFSPATAGTLTVNLDGTITYSPNVGFSGTDIFTYAALDASLVYSNVQTVTITVNLVNQAPIGRADVYSSWVGAPGRTFAPAANDTDVDGTVVAASILVTPPAAGNGVVVVNADGTITYTPTGVTTARTVTFSYTVADNLGKRSAATSVSIVVFGTAERLTISRNQYTRSTRAWRVTGTSSHFAAGLTNFVTLKRSGDKLVVGVAPIDVTGAWDFQPTPGSVLGPDGTNRLDLVSSGGAQILNAAISIK